MNKLTCNTRPARSWLADIWTGCQTFSWSDTCRRTCFKPQQRRRCSEPTSVSWCSPVDDADQLLQFFLPRLSVFVTGVRVPTLQDGKFKSLLKLLCCTCRHKRNQKSEWKQLNIHQSSVTCVWSVHWIIRLCLPRIPALTKWTRLKYSSRSFWMGVPEISTLLWALMAFKAW